MFSLLEPPLFTRLRDARRILVAGAGGGFDVYAGLPLALALRAAGKDVHLANLSFADLYGLDLGVWLEQDVAAIRPDTVARGDYFPERTLARWLALHNLLDRLEHTHLTRQISTVIEEFREELPHQRAPRMFPH